MGRMLEALLKSDRARPQVERVEQAEAPITPRLAVAPEAEEMIPFIEVGGPRNVLEASPDVMACPSRRPEPAASPAEPPPAIPPVSLTMSLFCSWNLPGAVERR